MHSHEMDKVQCQAVSTKTKKRCTLIGTHSDGGKVLCDRHIQIARRDRANAAPIAKEKK